MTHPYPAAPPQQPQYPAAPQGYAPPQQPQAPQGYQPNPYAPQAPQQYAPNPYAHPQTVQNYPGPAGYPYGYPQPPQAPQAPADPGVQASLGDFYAQPSTGWGPSITPVNATPAGTAVTFVVAQHITAAHVEHADEYQKQGVKAYFKNGAPKLVMKIPAYVAPGTQVYSATQGVQRIDDGRAQYYTQGGDKDLLAAAMATAGAPAGPPELGALIRVTKTGSRPNRSGTQSAVKTWEYWRPGPETAGIAAQLGIQYPDLNTPKPVDAAPAAEAAPAAPAPQAPPAPAQQFAPPAAPPVHQAPQGAPLPPPPAAPPAPQAPAAPPAAPQQFAPPAAPPAPAAVGELDPERQALLAKLTGQPVG